jgi:type IX secretion system PorP/SprF family membrane protein
MKKMLNQTRYIRSTITAFIGMLFTMAGNNANAQLTGLQAMYYQNQYLANPAMAGLETGLNINLGYQQQWTSIPGSPKIKSFTADYNPGKRMGLGLNISGDEAGLINNTRIMATYAYHLPLNRKDDKLNFGLSLGMNNAFIDYAKVNGDEGDISVQDFNQRTMYVDGDFGIAYTGQKFTVQAALPNLRTLFFSNNDHNNLGVDRSTFFSAVSYKIHFDNISHYTLEPKIAYRGVKGLDNILDAGAQITMDDYKFSIGGIYHTNKSMTFSFGLNLDALDILAAYGFSSIPLSAQSRTVEFGLKIKMFNR